MVDPNWVTAIGTAVVAVTGPVALFTWYSQRRDSREREREQRTLDQARREFLSKADDAEREQRLLERAGAQSVPRSAAVAGILFSAVAVALGVLTWSERRDRERP